MAVHVWSVLCEKMLTDDEVGSISLDTVIEKVVIPSTTEEIEKELSGARGLAYPMRLVTWCVRSDYGQGESFDLRAGWLCPDGEYVPSVSNRIELVSSHGTRVRIILSGIPWRGPGLYWLVVDKREDGEGWITAARLPLEVEVKAPE